MSNNTLVVIIVVLLVVVGFGAYKGGLLEPKHDVDIGLPGGKHLTADVKK